MSESAEKVTHTPGPWVELHDFDGDYGIFGGPNLVAVTNHDTDEDHANARLIAAAPEMLEALEELLGRVQGLLGGEPAELWCKADAAIRKAKGEL